MLPLSRFSHFSFISGAQTPAQSTGTRSQPSIIPAVITIIVIVVYRKHEKNERHKQTQNRHKTDTKQTQNSDKSRTIIVITDGPSRYHRLVIVIVIIEVVIIIFVVFASDGRCRKALNHKQSVRKGLGITSDWRIAQGAYGSHSSHQIDLLVLRVVGSG